MPKLKNPAICAICRARLLRPGHSLLPGARQQIRRDIPCESGTHLSKIWRMEQNPFTSTAANEFADNPEPRCASLLILDVSVSMQGERIRQLNEGLVAYKDDLAGDGLARKRVEVGIVTFGGTVDVVQNFATADIFTPPALTIHGDTPIG